METPVRQRSTRRVTLVALGISAAAHAAALAWLALPTPSFRDVQRPEARLVLTEPVRLVQLEMPAVATSQPTVTSATAAAEGGGAGLPGASAPSAGGASATPTVTPPVSTQPLALAAVDSVRAFDIVPAGAAEVAVAVAAPVATTSPEAVSTRPAPPTAHVPGSAASAKNRGAAESAGSGGSGASSGFGGITVKVGGGPKRHPPRGMPGRGRF